MLSDSKKTILIGNLISAQIKCNLPVKKYLVLFVDKEKNNIDLILIYYNGELLNTK